MSGALRILCDCPHCRVEGALVEVVDRLTTGGERVGACRLCGLETVAGVVTGRGVAFTTEGEVVAALSRWSAAEGEPEVAVFVRANFTGRGVAQVAQAVLTGQRVETSFDVVAWLFRDRTGGQQALGSAPVFAEAMGGGAGDRDGGAGEAARSGGAAGAGWSGEEGETLRPSPTIVPSEAALPADVPTAARDLTRALCALALCDGLVDEAERAALERERGKLGAPEPTPDDWRLWRPTDLERPCDPAAVLAAMRQVALANRLPDPSEERLLREYARHWGVALKEPALPPVTPMQKFVSTWQGWFGR